MSSKTGWAQHWNVKYGARLHLTPELIAFTLAPRFNPEQTPLVLSTPEFELLCKIEKNIFRLHLPIPLLENIDASSFLKNFGPSAVSLLKAEAQKRGAKKIVFGGGDYHLFPGVPLDDDLKLWLQWFSPLGEVVDLEAELRELVRRNESLACIGDLRNPQNDGEKKQLLDFVGEEFPGRWTREMTHDLSENYLKYYFAYFVDGQVLGYARLYGWDNKYRGPGTHFVRGDERIGALGPIGVSLKSRGKGIGLQILKSSWEILLTRGCTRVRVDWVSDIDFYEKRGLHIVQRYQMAQMQAQIPL